jgi:DNA-directed RNA polymerase I subunit RPA1
MDQLLRLLRAKCVYCHYLKMSRVVVNKFICKLRLIQHGLLLEMEELENIHIKPKSANKVGSRGGAAGESMNTTESENIEEDADLLMQRRTAFVKKVIKRAASSDRQWRYQKSEAVSQERRLVVKEFLSSISKERRCVNCGGLVKRDSNLLF